MTHDVSAADENRRLTKRNVRKLLARVISICNLACPFPDCLLFFLLLIGYQQAHVPKTVLLPSYWLLTVPFFVCRVLYF